MINKIWGHLWKKMHSKSKIQTFCGWHPHKDHTRCIP